MSKNIPILSEKDLERFWLKVKKTDGCWLWLGSTSKKGYGCFKSNHVNYGAHRISYFLATGEDADELCVLHDCDTPCCVNPAHLFVGTNQDNVDDRVRKGRQGPQTLVGEACSFAKLTEAQVKEIRFKAALGIQLKELARKYGVSPTTISFVVNRKRWKQVQ